MKKMLFPLPGGFFRPPAKQLLGVLQPGQRLRIIAEPENPYDGNAIGVFIEWDEAVLSEDAHAKLEAELQGCGYTPEELGPMSPIQLGYVGKSGGKPCQKLGLPGNQELLAEADGRQLEDLDARLALAPDGSPLVEVEL